MTLLVQKPGILTTVQDLGRKGWRRFGINPNGPMDPAAARIANLLVGNDENAALLEIHFPAGQFIFENEVIFSVCGGDFDAELNGRKVPAWRAVIGHAGSVLRFAGKVSGERCYLAVRGGIDVPIWLGSVSTNLAAHIGGYQGRRLEHGDRLNITPSRGNAPQRLPSAAASVLPRYRGFPTVRVVPGAEFDLLGKHDREKLFNSSFTITGLSNRMGFRLEGEALKLASPVELVSSAVCFGTIQLLSDGQLIILMADQQTAGGYPRIAHVISRDLPLIGQLGASDRVAFHLVDIEEAESLAVQFERDLSLLRAACRLAYK